MRINLDEPVPDRPEEAPEAPAEEGEEASEDEASAATAEFVIRRDESHRRRRRAAPRALTPAEQRALTVGLALVTLVALVSLGLYLNSLRRPAIRFPEGTPIARPAPPPRRQQAAPPQGLRRPSGPPVYQGPPPRGSEPLEEPARSDTSEPVEGIH